MNYLYTHKTRKCCFIVLVGNQYFIQFDDLFLPQLTARCNLFSAKIMIVDLTKTKNTGSAFTSNQFCET